MTRTHKSPVWAATQRVTRRLGKRPADTLTSEDKRAVRFLALKGFTPLYIYRILRVDSALRARPYYPSYKVVRGYYKDFASKNADMVRAVAEATKGISELARYEGYVIRVYGDALGGADARFKDELEDDIESLEDCSEPEGMCEEDA